MSVNKVILVGNLGKDPELRYTPSGVAVASFSMATTERFKDKNGEKQTKTEWHNIIYWRNLAEICGKYLHKGKQIYVEGKIQNRSYDDKDGNKRYISEVVINDMQMIGSRDDGQQQNNQPAQQNNNGYQQNNQQQGGSNGGRQSQGGGGYQEPAFNPIDEIPLPVQTRVQGT